MAVNLYCLANTFVFKSQSIEKKYMVQTNAYLKSSLNYLIFFLPVCAALSIESIIPMLLAMPLIFYRSYWAIRGVFLIISLIVIDCTFISLMIDWVSHLYTLRLPSYYCGSLLIRIIYWKCLGIGLDLDKCLTLALLVYLMVYTQIDFRKLWGDMEINKKKMMQEKQILNEIQAGVLVFSISGLVLSANQKAIHFLESRGIFSIEKVQHNDLFPADCKERAKSLFDLAVKGQSSDQEFVLSKELSLIPPLFSSVILVWKKTEYKSNPAVSVTITDISHTMMRRRLAGANQRAIEENSIILKETFLDLYLNKEFVKNKHLNSFYNYLLTQQNLSLLIENLLGECKVVKEFFDLKNQIVNTINLCWRAAKVKLLFLEVIFEKTLPKQVLGDRIKHNQLLKSLIEFIFLTADMKSEISVVCYLMNLNNGASIEYNLTFYSKILTSSELEFVFRTSYNNEPRLLEEMIEIYEKYGLGAALFDVLFTALDGNITKLSIQDNNCKVSISYM